MKLLYHICWLIKTDIDITFIISLKCIFITMQKVTVLLYQHFRRESKRGHLYCDIHNPEKRTQLALGLNRESFSRWIKQDTKCTNVKQGRTIDDFDIDVLRRELLKMCDVEVLTRESLSMIDMQFWKKCVEHVLREEDEYWHRDGLQFVQPVTIINLMESSDSG